MKCRHEYMFLTLINNFKFTIFCLLKYNKKPLYLPASNQAVLQWFVFVKMYHLTYLYFLKLYNPTSLQIISLL